MRPAIVHEHDLGLTWVAAEALERSAHALVDERRVWLVDPTDDAAALERAAALGETIAVVQLFDRHGRDGPAIARRLGVPFVRIPTTLPGTPFEVITALSAPGWREAALWWPERRALVVPEVVGTAPHYAVGDGELGIHPFLRLRPPGALRAYRPEHLLVGHGPPLHGPQVPEDLDEAYASSVRDLPRMFGAAPRLARAALGRWSGAGRS
jgi:hypothetical protein